MPNPATISTAIATCISCKATAMLFKKGAAAGVKDFIQSEAFDHFDASGVCMVCLGVSGYGVVV